MLRLLLHNTRTRHITTQLLKTMAAKPNAPTVHDQRELAAYLGNFPCLARAASPRDATLL